MTAFELVVVVEVAGDLSHMQGGIAESLFGYQLNRLQGQNHGHVIAGYDIHDGFIAGEAVNIVPGAFNHSGRNAVRTLFHRKGGAARHVRPTDELAAAGTIDINGSI